MDRKRLIFLILFILVSIVLGYALYRVFFAKPKAPALPIPIGISAPGKQFPITGSGAPARPGAAAPGALPTAGVTAGRQTFERAAAPVRESIAVAGSVSNATVDRSGAVQYYDVTDGKFYRLGADGKPTPLSDQVFYNVERVAWSPNRADSIIEYPDGANIYYNFQTKKQATLPKHWENFSFAAQGDQIAAKSIGLDPGNRWLLTSDPDGSNVTLLEALGENGDKVTVDWSPNRQVVALSRTGEALDADRQQVLLIGAHHENFKAMTVEGRDLRTQWAPDQKHLLYSVYSARSDFKPELWITDADGASVDTSRRPLSLYTWADKCAFASDRTLYCGVPTSLELGIGFEPTLADTISDQIYRIDLSTGLKTPIALDGTHTVKNILIGDNGKTLYFTDKSQAGLFKVSL